MAATANKRMTVWELLHHATGDVIVKWNWVPVTFGTLDGSDTPLHAATTEVVTIDAEAVTCRSGIRL